MKIAREGYPLILAAAVVTILAFVLGWVAIGVILGICTLAIAAFFRDPERTIPTGEGLIVSPADGRVVSIADIKDDPKFRRGGDAREYFSFAPRRAHQSKSGYRKGRRGQLPAGEVFCGLQRSGVSAQRTERFKASSMSRGARCQLCKSPA